MMFDFRPAWGFCLLASGVGTLHTSVTPSLMGLFGTIQTYSLWWEGSYLALCHQAAFQRVFLFRGLTYFPKVENVYSVLRRHLENGNQAF